MLELLTRPLIIVFRFGIKEDEALRVGSSGFLGKSDAGDEDEGSVPERFYKLIIILFLLEITMVVNLIH